MGVIASLDSKLVAVSPGAEARVEIKVRNSGTVVDQMSLSVVGDASGWAYSEPSTLSLFPGAEEAATIVFDPPRDASVRAGELPFGVRVASQEDPAGSVVEEGRLDVAPFTEVNAELQPMTSRGSRGAKHDLAVDNRGNVALNADIDGFDSNEDVGLEFRPPSVVVDPGQAAFAEVAVKPRQRIWRGQPKSRSFTVQVETAGQPPIPVSGTYLQEPILPGWFIKGVVALAVIAILLLLFWFFVLQPALLTAAEERAEEVAAPIAKQAAEAAIEEAGITPGGGAGDASPSPSPSPAASPSPTPVITPPPTLPPPPTPAPPTATPVVQTPRHARLRAGSQVRLPADGKALHLTDLVFSNPMAQVGEITLRRNDEDDMLILRLENFRDLDFHFVTPLVINPGDRLSLRCTDGVCEGAAMLYSGYEQ